MMEAAFRRPGAYVNTNKQALLKTAVLNACDMLDGAADGIVSNLEACKTAFDVNKLRCPDGADTGDSCLSDIQIDTLNTAATPMKFAFPFSNGVTENGPYPVYNGADLFLWLGVAPLEANSFYNILSDGVIRYFIQQNPASTTTGFDYRAWQPRVQQLSQLLDASDPNLDAFKSHGGKMIMVQGTEDMFVPHQMTSAYFNSVKDRYKGQTGSFVKYYVQPGLAHGDGTFPMTWDALSALEAWVERGVAPANPVGVAGDRSRPLCEYPLWPKYNGSGDINDAANFSCVR